MSEESADKAAQTLTSKFTPIAYWPLANGGIQLEFSFPNNYGCTIISAPILHSGIELDLMWDGDYAPEGSPGIEAVTRGLKIEDLEAFMDSIAALPEKEN